MVVNKKILKIFSGQNKQSNSTKNPARQNKNKVSGPPGPVKPLFPTLRAYAPSRPCHARYIFIFFSLYSIRTIILIIDTPNNYVFDLYSENLGHPGPVKMAYSVKYYYENVILLLRIFTYLQNPALSLAQLVQDM